MSAAGRRLKIGVHPNNLHLRLARALAASRRDERFVFVDYADGRSTGELIGSGVIDLGGTGSTPPLTARAAGLDVAYLAASAPRPANGALLVREGAGATRLRDLRGKRIALIEGSFHTYLLAHLAEQDGLSLGDFQRIDLSPSASAVSLRAGDIEAWIAMDPHLPAELAGGGLAVVPGSQGAVPNRSLFWTSRGRLDADPAGFAAALALLTDVAAYVDDAPDAAAGLLSQPGDASAERWLAVLRSRDWRLDPAEAVWLAEQEHEARCLIRHGALSAISDASLERDDATPATAEAVP